MNRKGNCWDNAPIESFFGAWKPKNWTISDLHPKHQSEWRLSISSPITTPSGSIHLWNIQLHGIWERPTARCSLKPVSVFTWPLHFVMTLTECIYSLRGVSHTGMRIEIEDESAD
jgi:transposase InsO family protein